MRFFYAIMVCALVGACGNSDEGAVQSTDPTTQSGPEDCHRQWYESGVLDDPQQAYDMRCFVGAFTLFGEEDVPGCFTSDYEVHYLKDGADTPFAVAESGGYGRGYYKLFDEQGNMIMRAQHDHVGGPQRVFVAHYWAFDDAGREIDFRGDYFVTSSESFIPEFGHDGLMHHAPFESYFPYDAYIAGGHAVVDFDGRWDACERKVYRADVGTVELPNADEIPNEGRCSVSVIYERPDGQWTFWGSYNANRDEWEYHRTRTYSDDGQVLSERWAHIPASGLVSSEITIFEYDAEGRLVIEKTDKHEDNTFEREVVYTWNGNVVHEVSTSTHGTYAEIREYDAAGRLVRRDDDFTVNGDPLHREAYKYDAAGNTIYEAEFDAKSVDMGGFTFDKPYRVIEREYNTAGQITRESRVVHPDELARSFVFDDDRDLRYTYYPEDAGYAAGKLKQIEEVNDGYSILSNREVFLYHCE